MDKIVFYRQLSSPLGKLLLTSDGQALTGLFMTRLAEDSAPEMSARWRQDDAPFRDVCEQLEAYFEGEATSFDIAMDPAGTPLPAQGLERALHDSLRHRDLLRRARPADRPADRQPRRRRGERPEPDLDHRPLPPRDRRRRHPRRLRRRPRPQALAPRPRGRGPGAAPGVEEWLAGRNPHSQTGVRMRMLFLKSQPWRAMPSPSGRRWPKAG